MAYCGYYPDALCPNCMGRRYEPSAITTIRERCRACDGAGYFRGGRPKHPIPFREFIAQQKQEQSQ
jgi:hypothetical protein